MARIFFPTFVLVLLHLLHRAEANLSTLNRSKRQFSPFSRIRNGGFIFPDQMVDDRAFLDSDAPAVLRPVTSSPFDAPVTTTFTPTVTTFASTANPVTSSPASTDITRSTAYRRCINNCLTTNEYNPVCGTNDQSYDNQNKLQCAISCGADVRLKRSGLCQRLA